MSEITPISTRKRKATQSSEPSTPAVETKRRRASAAVSEQTPAVLTGRSVGRKRKVNSDNVSVTSDVASVDNSVEESVTRSLRSGRKRIATDSSVSNLSGLIENGSIKENLPLKPPRKSVSRRKSSAEITSTERDEPQTDFSKMNDSIEADSNSTPVTTQNNENDINDAIIFSPGKSLQNRSSSRLSTSSAISPTTPSTATVAPRSVSKSRKSLASSGIATLEPVTPTAHNIISNLSPHEPVRQTPRTPRTPAVNVTGSSNTVQIASVAAFPPDTVISAQTEAMQGENAFTLEDSNNWWSWLSAALLVFISVGSFYRQLTLPKYEFHPSKFSPATITTTPTIFNAAGNESSFFDSSTSDPAVPASDQLLSSVHMQLPNVSHIEWLYAESLKEKELTQTVLDNISLLSPNSQYVELMEEMHRTISSIAGEIDQQLLELEYSTSLLEQHHELLPLESLPANSHVDTEIENLLFTSSYDIREDPPAIEETILGKTTREFRHNTEGLSPDDYQAEAERQFREMEQNMQSDLDNHISRPLHELVIRMQQDETLVSDLDQYEPVSGQVKDLFEKVTGEAIDFDTISVVTEGTYPSVDEVVDKVSKVVDMTNQRVAQFTETVENRVEAALKATVSAAVAEAIAQEKSSILQEVVRDSAKRIEEHINRIPKLPLKLPSVVDDEENDEDEGAYEDEFSPSEMPTISHEELVAMDDIASSAAGARMILLESSNYCMKAKGDPISCATANLRIVNSPAVIHKPGDCYAFGKLEKNDALTVRFFQPSTVFGFGLSHFIPNAGARDSDKYNVDCAPKNIYFTLHQAGGGMEDHIKRSKLPKMFRSVENFISFDSSNFTFSPSSLELRHFDITDQGYSVSQSFPLPIPAANISKVTLHVRSTEKPNNMACVYRLKVYGKANP